MHSVLFRKQVADKLWTVSVLSRACVRPAAHTNEWKNSKHYMFRVKISRRSYFYEIKLRDSFSFFKWQMMCGFVCERDRTSEWAREQTNETIESVPCCLVWLHLQSTYSWKIINMHHISTPIHIAFGAFVPYSHVSLNSSSCCWFSHVCDVCFSLFSHNCV